MRRRHHDKNGARLCDTTRCHEASVRAAVFTFFGAYCRDCDDVMQEMQADAERDIRLDEAHGYEA